MNVLVVEVKKYYEEILYKFVFKVGYYDFFNVCDIYCEVCIVVGIFFYKDFVFKYIRFQVFLFIFIVFYWVDFVW